MKELVRLLRSAAHTLHPFTNQVLPSSLGWDGERYAAPRVPQEADAGAAMWFGTVVAAAELLERQGSVTDAQLDYLRDIFRGGMGTFFDFSLDTRRYGPAAAVANENLRLVGQQLFEHLGSRSPAQKI